MDLDALFGGGDSGVDTVDEPETDEVLEEHAEDPADEENIGWKVLVLLICGGLVVTALAVAFMVWVIEGLVL
ncbi:hypothetical protein [Lentzea sp.]|uniref:hypothetical protein n=1 Tax=Lentzea sp. TaxID=56099 RepID=UPI002BFF75BF|nr:hypothetical protein [Lentzea sp.]HUQ59660.1 hypothetical protein [Lentzea sp.]